MFLEFGDSRPPWGAVPLVYKDVPPGDRHFVVCLLRQHGVTECPEPTTMIVGALLLLPFGASALRLLRKSRKA